MRDGPQASGRSAVIGYAAAVAVAFAVFEAGIVLDAYLHPVASPSGSPVGVVEAVFAFLTMFLLMLVASLVPVWVGLAAFRRARVTNPTWFAVYGIATGLLLANIFRDLTTGLALPGLAGAAGGLTLRAVMGRPAEPSVVEAPADSPKEDPRAVRGRLADHEAQIAYLSSALASDDPALVVLALKEIATARRIPVALDENPQLGEVLRTTRELKFDLVALRAGP